VRISIVVFSYRDTFLATFSATTAFSADSPPVIFIVVKFYRDTVLVSFAVAVSI
jgi:hypothetical protein